MHGACVMHETVLSTLAAIIQFMQELNVDAIVACACLHSSTACVFVVRALDPMFIV